MTTQRAGSSYYVAATVLVVAIGAFVVLAALVIRSPQHLSRFQADAPTNAACLPGSEADACFNLHVFNVGNASGYLQCSVTPASGTSALFHSSGLPNADGTGGYQPSDIYTSSTAVQPGQGLILTIEVKADKGTQPTRPYGICISVPAPAAIGA
jgi:hypothetical protein